MTDNIEGRKQAIRNTGSIKASSSPW